MTSDPVEAAIVVTFTIPRDAAIKDTYTRLTTIMNAIKAQVGDQIRDGYILTGRQHLATIADMTRDAIEPGSQRSANGHS